MSEIIAKKIGRSLLASHATALEPRDPLYEVPTPDPRTGKLKRRKRELPPGLTKEEEKILKKVRKRARCLDRGFSLCGFRFGWTAVIGLIPVVGDVLDAALSYYLVIRPARKCNLPPLLVQRILLNQAVATSVGLVPLVGDILMAVWKVNSRNAALFEDYLTARGQQALSQAQPSAPVPPTETQRLVENSKKTSYISGMTGQREAASSGVTTSPVASGSSPAAQDGPSPSSTKKSKSWFGMRRK